jgi:3-hydroxy-3-methylglutaryl CoA synthase
MISNDYLFSNIGIDSLSFYAPHHYLDIGELAVERNIDPNKYKKGLLLKEMRLPGLDEDIISMGLKAGYNALIRGNINPKSVDAIFVGTETITYAVKSVSNIFAELLGISRNSITQDIYNACAAGTLAMINAMGLIQNGIINRALIINADISSYELGSPSEATQGSGAVAFVISKNPRIAAFSKKFGKVSGNVNDFFRSEGDHDAQVFGQFSVDSYLNFQMEAYEDLTKNIGNFYTDYYVFHAPFSKLPLKCMQQIILKHWSSIIVNTMKFMKPKENRTPLRKKFDNIVQNLSLIPEFIYKKLEARGFKLPHTHLVSNSIYKIIKERALPQLRVPMHFGNMYSASVWAQFLYILENHARINDTVYFGSYGSGATCISGLLKVQPKFESLIKKGPFINDFIKNKEKVSIHEYEMSKKGLVKPIIHLAKIMEHEENNHRGFVLHFCDQGCLIPNLDGLSYCPKGHTGFNEKFFPLYAILKSEPKITNIKDLSFFMEDLVRVAPKAKEGNLLEYEIRRINFKDYEINDVSGLLNWAPFYKPTHVIY